MEGLLRIGWGGGRLLGRWAGEEVVESMGWGGGRLVSQWTGEEGGS